MQELIGKTLGTYEILEQIGQGGMAQLFKAYETDLDRFVVVKVISSASASDPGFGLHFQREAHSMARLQHPHILQLYNYGVQDHYCYLAMQYVADSTTLADLIRAGSPPEPLIEYLAQVAGALDYAHKQGVVHWDVKPGNILIDQRGGALLTGFDSVRLAEIDNKLAQTDLMLGTPAYLAPEQILGGEIGPYTDIYALGVILYQILTGQIPHDGPTPLDILRKRPIEPVTTPREINPGISPTFEQIILRALARNPAERYETAAALKSALLDTKVQEQEDLQPPPSSENSNPLDQLEQLLSGKAGVEELTRRLFQFNYEQAHQRDPELAEMMRACAIPRAFDTTIIGVLRTAPNDAEKNERLLDELRTYTFVLPHQEGIYTYHDNIRQLLLADWQQPENETQLRQYRERLVTYYTAQGEAHQDQDKHEAALAAFDRAIELQPAQANLYANRGRAYLALGDYPAARRDLRKAVESGLHRREIYLSLGTADYYLQDYSACLANMTKVIELDPNDAVACNNRGSTYRNLKQYEAALADYTQALRLNPQYAAAYYNRGNTYYDLKLYEAALADYTQALRLNPEHANTYYNRGNTYYDLQRYEAALADYTEVIRLDSGYTLAYSNRGNIYFDLKQYEAALADYAEAIHLNPQYAAAYYNLACLHAQQNQVEAALLRLRQALELNLGRYLPLIPTDPDFEPVRDDPRFRALLAEFENKT